MKAFLICLRVLNFLTSNCPFQGGGDNIVDGGNNCMRTGKIAGVVSFHKCLEKTMAVECERGGGRIFHLVYPNMSSHYHRFEFNG